MTTAEPKDHPTKGFVPIKTLLVYIFQPLVDLKKKKKS